MNIYINKQAFEIISNDNTSKLEKDFLYYILNLIEIFPEIDEFGFVRISSKYLDQKKWDYHLYIKYLIDNKIIRSNGKYKVKEYAKGYRLNDIDIITSFETINISINNKYDISDAAKHQNKVLSNVTIDASYDIFKDNLYKREIKREFPKGYTEKLNLPMKNIERKVSESKLTGRVYSPVTLMKSEYRSFLKLNGTELYEIDLSNSQPLFLYLSIKELQPELTYTASVQKYYSDVIQGQLYENMMMEYKKLFPKYSNIERSQIKLSVLGMLFSRDKNIEGEDTKFRSNTRKVFQYLYPEVYKFIIEIKEDKYQQLSINLTKMESEIFINALYEVTQGEVEYLTVHDAVYTTQYNMETLLYTLKKLFQDRYNVTPNIKVNKLKKPSVQSLLKTKHLKDKTSSSVNNNIVF